MKNRGKRDFYNKIIGKQYEKYFYGSRAKCFIINDYRKLKGGNDFYLKGWDEWGGEYIRHKYSDFINIKALNKLIRQGQVKKGALVYILKTSD